MTIFKSRQVNLDPEPWVTGMNASETRFANRCSCGCTRFDPRPEFEPTRDPYPYRAVSAGRNVRYSHNDDNDPRIEWSPRREQFDTPVNPILVTVRGWLADGTVTSYGSALWKINNGGIAATPAEIDHARRVLTRLAKWKEQ